MEQKKFGHSLYNIMFVMVGLVLLKGVDVDIITLKEGKNGKRFYKWTGNAQYSDNPVKNILDSWINKQLSLLEVQKLVSQFQG